MFLLGLGLDRWLSLGGIGVVLGAAAGVVLSVGWAYLLIARHLEKYAPSKRDSNEDA